MEWLFANWKVRSVSWVKTSDTTSDMLAYWNIFHTALIGYCNPFGFQRQGIKVPNRILTSFTACALRCFSTLVYPGIVPPFLHLGSRIFITVKIQFSILSQHFTEALKIWQNGLVFQSILLILKQSRTNLLVHGQFVVGRSCQNCLAHKPQLSALNTVVYPTPINQYFPLSL